MTTMKTSSKMNPVVHFEMPAVDKSRMTEFYTKAFGWRTQMLGSEMGEYVLVTTTESGKDGRPKMPGAINGGFYKKSDDIPAPYPSVVIAVDDIKDSATLVTDAGGKVIGEPIEIPGVGQYVSFFDTEGNRVSMLQPVPRDGHAPK
jgi:predicted enzyme related to lactoylglutathione lyase